MRTRNNVKCSLQELQIQIQKAYISLETKQLVQLKKILAKDRFEKEDKSIKIIIIEMRNI